MEKSNDNRQRRTAAIVLAATAAFMTTFIVIWCMNGPEKFLNYLGFSRSGEVLPHAWLLAAATAAGYIAYTARMIPEVRQNLLCFKGLLKWLGIYAGFAGGIVEEAVFRQMLMDWLQGNGACALLQIVHSAPGRKPAYRDSLGGLDRSTGPAARSSLRRSGAQSAACRGGPCAHQPLRRAVADTERRRSQPPRTHPPTA